MLSEKSYKQHDTSLQVLESLPAAEDDKGVALLNIGRWHCLFHGKERKIPGESVESLRIPS
ncbi:hypothetical protein [Candidatus Methylobacter favarea]|uniref:hypothetical protein n=1 Tax=Candidatus Methylobacter favarea TaxID=2707345 RepID=UPI00157C64D4|nr:hypothetical protein [Candidatus Methylobacter favarea]